MLKTMSNEKLKIDRKEHLKTKVKDQPSSNAASDFIASSIANVALIQPLSSKSPIDKGKARSPIWNTISLLYLQASIENLVFRANYTLETSSLHVTLFSI